MLRGNDYFIKCCKKIRWLAETVYTGKPIQSTLLSPFEFRVQRRLRLEVSLQLCCLISLISRLTFSLIFLTSSTKLLTVVAFLKSSYSKISLGAF